MHRFRMADADKARTEKLKKKARGKRQKDMRYSRSRDREKENEREGERERESKQRHTHSPEHKHIPLIHQDKDLQISKHTYTEAQNLQKSRKTSTSQGHSPPFLAARSPLCGPGRSSVK